MTKLNIKKKEDTRETDVLFNVKENIRDNRVTVTKERSIKNCFNCGKTQIILLKNVLTVNIVKRRVMMHIGAINGETIMYHNVLIVSEWDILSKIVLKKVKVVLIVVIVIP